MTQLLQRGQAGPLGGLQSAASAVVTQTSGQTSPRDHPQRRRVHAHADPSESLCLSTGPVHTTDACLHVVRVHLSLFHLTALWESFKKGIPFKTFRYLFCNLLLEPAAIIKLYIIENSAGNE